MGLDPRQIIDVRNLIKNLAGSHTVILSTHILPEVSMTCSRVAIINRGQIVATNTLSDFMAQLSEGSGYEVEVDGDIQALQPLLQLISGVRLVEEIGADRSTPLPEDRKRLRLLSEFGIDPGREIAQMIVGAGLGLYEMRRTRATLEDVFLNLTTEEKPVDRTDVNSETPSEAISEESIDTSDADRAPLLSEPIPSEPSAPESSKEEAA